jgi:hypothetical protein
MVKTATVFAISTFALMSLTSCAGHPVVTDISQDKVILQGNNAPDNELQSKATESCNMYHKARATFMSQRCGDAYCIQKFYLFSCTDLN